MNQTIGQRRTLHGFNHRPRRNVRRRRRAARANAHLGTGVVERLSTAAERIFESGCAIVAALVVAGTLLWACVEGYVP